VRLLAGTGPIRGRAGALELFQHAGEIAEPARLAVALQHPEVAGLFTGPGRRRRRPIRAPIEGYTFLMGAEQSSENLDHLHASDADLATPAPRTFKAGALKGRLIVPDNFLDPDPELESLFYDGQILSGVPDEELLTVRSEPPDPVESARRSE